MTQRNKLRRLRAAITEEVCLLKHKHACEVANLSSALHKSNEQLELACRSRWELEHRVREPRRVSFDGPPKFIPWKIAQQTFKLLVVEHFISTELVIQGHRHLEEYTKRNMAEKMFQYIQEAALISEKTDTTIYAKRLQMAIWVGTPCPQKERE